MSEQPDPLLFQGLIGHALARHDDAYRKLFYPDLSAKSLDDLRAMPWAKKHIDRVMAERVARHQGLTDIQRPFHDSTDRGNMLGGDMTNDWSRRAVLAGAGAVLVAPMLPAIAAPLPRIHGDGIHDDTEGFRALFAGEPYVTDLPGISRDSSRNISVVGGDYYLPGGVNYDHTPDNGMLYMSDCRVRFAPLGSPSRHWSTSAAPDAIWPVTLRAPF